MQKRNIVLGCAVGFFTLYRAQPYEPIVIVGQSMNPTLEHHQLLIATRDVKEVNRGDIVVFVHDGAQVIKRVAGLPGDKITLYEQSGEWVLPRLDVFKNFLEKKNRPKRTVIVPEGTLYVLGDNPGASIDSRTYGPIPYSELRAKLIDTDTGMGLIPSLKISDRLSVKLASEGN